MCFTVNYFILPLCLFGGFPSKQILKFKTFQSLQHETHAQGDLCFLAITLCLLFVNYFFHVVFSKLVLHALFLLGLLFLHKQRSVFYCLHKQ
jgi:hypothetical protein